MPDLTRVFPCTEHSTSSYRVAMVTACARAGLAKAAALEVLAAVEADVERAAASQAEVDELQARFRRELAAIRVADGRTVARHPYIVQSACHPDAKFQKKVVSARNH